MSADDGLGLTEGSTGFRSSCRTSSSSTSRSQLPSSVRTFKLNHWTHHPDAPNFQSLSSPALSTSSSRKRPPAPSRAVVLYVLSPLRFTLTPLMTLFSQIFISILFNAFQAFNELPTQMMGRAIMWKARIKLRYTSLPSLTTCSPSTNASRSTLRRRSPSPRRSPMRRSACSRFW